MKRFWGACAILALLTGATIWQGHYIAGYLEHMAQSLDQAQALVEKDKDGDQARRLSEDVFSMWETHKFHLHATMNHQDTDQVLFSIQSVRQYLQLEELDQYVAANAQLAAQLRLLVELEQPTLENIL